MSKKYFYITTTIPYVNAEPHIGFALEIIQADVLARYHRLLKEEIFFNTGTDEHGQKIYQKALKENKNPKAYVDEYAQKYDNLKKALSLSYNSFLRTTDFYHIKAAREFWLRCLKNKYIYKAKQKIKYCIGCELEKTDSELVDGKCPIHPNLNLDIREEENYFFRFSKFQKPLLDFYSQNPNFVVPDTKYKEIKNFVKNGLNDFSISRLKKKMPWGVDVPGDNMHVMYVWFDALINYVSALGWPDKNKGFKKWWPGTQIAGKDNLRQQSAMWQAMLMAAGLPNSKQILIHGFITANGQKMSKSLGNVVNPFDLVSKYGTDAVRYYLLKEIPATSDGDFTISHFEKVYNADLANGLGNLVQRVVKLCEKKEYSRFLVFPTNLSPSLKTAGYNVHLEKFEFNLALEKIWRQIKKTDILINQKKPWALSNNNAQEILSDSVRNILDIAFALQPFLPQTAKNIREIFTDKKIKAPKKLLFPRII